MTQKIGLQDILAAVEMADIGHAVTNRAGHILDSSPTFRKQMEFQSPGDYVDLPWFRLDPAPRSMHRERQALWDEFITDGNRWQGVVRWHLHDGSIRYFEGTAIPFEEDRVILITNDRTDRVNANRSLREAEELQRQVLAELPLSVCVTQTDGTIIYINHYLPHRLGKGRNGFIGQTMTSAFGKEMQPLTDAIFQKVIATGSAVDAGIVELEDGPLAGTHWLCYGRPLETAKGALSGTLTIIADRTDSIKLRLERTRFAEAIHETQKIAALNNFAGNLAHELSNLLHPVGAYARMLHAAPDHADRIDYTDKINQGVMAAGRILRRTLSMAHKDASPIAQSDLVPLIAETVASAGDLATADLSYRFDAPQGEILATYQPGELRQVLLNLLNNAAEAMQYRGCISITLQGGLDRPRDLDIMPVGTPPFARISITDEGPGIAPEIRERIFEPFFTTKPMGRGTGLGLPVVRGLVTAWGGFVSAAPEPGPGTTFHVWIPQSAVPNE